MIKELSVRAIIAVILIFDRDSESKWVYVAIPIPILIVDPWQRRRTSLSWTGTSVGTC